MENERTRILLEDKRSKFSMKSELRSISMNFKPILIEEVSRNWMELLSLSEGKLIILLQVMNNSDEINCNLKNNDQNKIGIFVKFLSRVFIRWKKMKRLQELRNDEFSIQDLIENQDTINELTARIQGLQNSRSQPTIFFPSCRDPGGLRSRPGEC